MIVQSERLKSSKIDLISNVVVAQNDSFRQNKDLSTTQVGNSKIKVIFDYDPKHGTQDGIGLQLDRSKLLELAVSDLSRKLSLIQPC